MQERLRPDVLCGFSDPHNWTLWGNRPFTSELSFTLYFLSSFHLTTSLFFSFLFFSLVPLYYAPLVFLSFFPPAFFFHSFCLFLWSPSLIFLLSSVVLSFFFFPSFFCFFSSTFVPFYTFSCLSLFPFIFGVFCKPGQQLTFFCIVFCKDFITLHFIESHTRMHSGTPVGQYFAVFSYFIAKPAHETEAAVHSLHVYSSSCTSSSSITWEKIPIAQPCGPGAAGPTECWTLS